MTTQPKFGEWIKKADREPEFAEWLLAYYPGWGYSVLRCIEGRIDDYGMAEVAYVDENHDLTDDEFTHWTPLPEAPNE